MRGSDIVTAMGGAASLIGAAVVEITMIPLVAGIILMTAGIMWGEEAKKREEKTHCDARTRRARRMRKNIDIRVGK